MTRLRSFVAAAALAIVLAAPGARAQVVLPQSIDSLPTATTFGGSEYWWGRQGGADKIFTLSGIFSAPVFGTPTIIGAGTFASFFSSAPAISSPNGMGIGALGRGVVMVNPTITANPSPNAHTRGIWSYPSFQQPSGTATLGNAVYGEMAIGAGYAASASAGGAAAIGGYAHTNSGAAGTVSVLQGGSFAVSNLPGATTTITEADAVELVAATVAAGNSIPSAVGLKIDPNTVGTTGNVDILLASSPPSGNWSIYDTDTTPSYFAGPIQLVGLSGGSPAKYACFDSSGYLVSSVGAC